MDYRIASMQAFQLLGKAQRQFIGDVQANIFWEKCQQDGTLTVLTNHSTSPDKALIGLVDAASSDGESYSYVIGTPYYGETVPAGFTLHTLSACQWVKFTCSSFGAQNTANKDIWAAIYSDFFPDSGLEPTQYQLEVYPHGDDALSEIWVSVALKRSNT